MRYYTKPFASDMIIKYETLSTKDILDQYFHEWMQTVIVEGGQNFTSEEQCIQDWITLHGAWETDSKGYHVLPKTDSSASGVSE